MNKKPNVIVFFTDQQRWDTTGIHGNPLSLTPNFDRLAKNGCFIEHSYTNQPVCGPARSALQTGKYPTTTGCFRNDIPLPKNEKTLAHAFSQAGYTTGYIGKWHLANQEPVPMDQRGGYEYWLASNILEFTSRPYQTRLYDTNNSPVDLPGYRVDALTDAAIDWVCKDHDNPFFLFLSFLEPHHQNQTDDYPAPLGSEHRILEKMTELPKDLNLLGGSSREHYAGYMGMVERLDAALGRLVDSLHSTNQLENTIILFTSDHGCHFKTRNSEYKRSCHDASIRVPSFFYGKGIDAGTVPDRQVALIDLPPTLLSFAGIEIPRKFQGYALDNPNAPEDIFIQISEAELGRALRTKRWKYGITAPDKDPWHDSKSDTYIETYLYDLDNDPHELDNKVNNPSYEEVRKKLSKRLIERMIKAGEDAPLIRPSSLIKR